MQSARELNAALSPLQRSAALRDYPPVPRRCVVTGGTGFVGMRLVEMLVERGAEEVICFDIVPPDAVAVASGCTCWTHHAIKYVVGDISVYSDVEAVVRGADCVWHLAAAVGPFHPHALYHHVNVIGTQNVLRACKQHGVRKLVFSSSPSTRFRGSLFSRPNVDGLSEDEMPELPLRHYMQMYAATKAEAELAVRAACGDDLWAIAVAPHQVYGPRDNLFLPNMLEAAGTGKLRVFGSGNNRICFTHVDNYCHGLILAERQLFRGSPVLGKFYIVTDGDTHPEPGAYCLFWHELDKAVVAMGFVSIWRKMHYPFWLLYILALCTEVAGWLLHTTFKLNVFNVFVLTMNRWFRIDAATRDLQYTPIVAFEPGWRDTIAWFAQYWLPRFKAHANASLAGLSASSQKKIQIQAAHTHHTRSRHVDVSDATKKVE